MNIFYNSTSGAIIGANLGEDGDSFAASLIPQGADSVAYFDNNDVTAQKAYAEHTDYLIQNNAIVSSPVPDSKRLEDAKNAKLTELNVAYENAQMAGFTSSATGTQHTYFSDLASQIKFNAILNRLNLDTTGAITTVDWNTMDAGKVTHTRQQIIQVFDDGFGDETSIHDKINGYNTQVQAITLDSQTLEQAMTQLSTITWS